MRTKEEMAEYQRLRRASLNVTNGNVTSGFIAEQKMEEMLSTTLPAIDIEVPCKVPSLKPVDGETKLDLVKDLMLDLRKDLGITSWSENGIMITPEITVQQVQNICALIRAKRGSEQRVYV